VASRGIELNLMAEVLNNKMNHSKIQNRNIGETSEYMKQFQITVSQIFQILDPHIYPE
jgi:hypothetical protein